MLSVHVKLQKKCIVIGYSILAISSVASRLFVILHLQFEINTMFFNDVFINLLMFQSSQHFKCFPV